MEKYGAKSWTASQEGKDKIKDIIKERYNVDNISQLSSVKQKVKETNKEKYGTEYYTQSQDFKDKSLKKFGVDNPMKNDEIRQKATLTLSKNGTVKISKLEIKMCKLLQQIYGEENCFPSYAFNNYVFDCLLVVNNCKIDVEYDSTYWHKNRKKYDRARDEVIKRQGYKIFRIESDKDKLPSEEQIEECINYLVSKGNYTHIMV